MLQLRSTADRARNLEETIGWIEKAAAAGARFVATPENSDAIAPRDERIATAETIDGPFLTTLRARARSLGIWLLVGSFAERTDDATRVQNTSALLGPDGEIVSLYRKMHLFDADPADGVRYRESEAVEPGREVVDMRTPLAHLGLSVCYDLRFPELYRALSQRGAEVLLVPSAFTVPTGRAHWELLLRARAVENLSYVLAPAQVGDHGHGRRSWGHALAIDPWGEVLADAGGDEPGFVTVRLDPGELQRVRRMLPALQHRRLGL